MSLALALEAHVVQAGSQRPIIGQWCGVDDYVINVADDDIFFHPRRGFYSPPAIDVSTPRTPRAPTRGRSASTVFSAR